MTPNRIWTAQHAAQARSWVIDGAKKLCDMCWADSKCCTCCQLEGTETHRLNHHCEWKSRNIISDVMGACKMKVKTSKEDWRNNGSQIFTGMEQQLRACQKGSLKGMKLVVGRWCNSMTKKRSHDVLYGTMLAGLERTIDRAELSAFTVTLAGLIGPFNIHTVIDGL